MSASTDPSSEPASNVTFGTPPLSAQPVRMSSTDESRARLHRVAVELIRSGNRKLLTEFLTLRRSVA